MHKRIELAGMSARTLCLVALTVSVFGEAVRAQAPPIRIIQLMLGHASIQQTQRYLNVTDEELRRGLEVSWGRPLRAASGG